MSNHLPVSVIIVTKNEAERIGECLKGLKEFDDVIVVDSCSDDETRSIAERSGARVVDFRWNGAYPKKRQWCLENLDLKYEWVLFIDADEHMTPVLADEIRILDFSCAGYFVPGRYVINGRPLKFGLKNNKLALFDRSKIEFPVIDDLNIAGMGEIEGHYQPVLKPAFQKDRIGQLRHSLNHLTAIDDESWAARHTRYARWERGMNDNNAWPRDPMAFRQRLKQLFRCLPGRPFWAFSHSYFAKLGILDGAAGYKFARSRYKYYQMIKQKV